MRRARFNNQDDKRHLVDWCYNADTGDAYIEVDGRREAQGRFSWQYYESGDVSLFSAAHDVAFLPFTGKMTSLTVRDFDGSARLQGPMVEQTGHPKKRFQQGCLVLRDV